MARIRLTACLIGASAALGALPAAAQFNPFEALFGSPPRPPAGVPSGRQPAPQEGYPGQQQYPRQEAYPGQQPYPRQEQYPRQQPYPGQAYPGQPYPGQANVPPPGGPGGIQSQPLPPPPGGTAAVDPRGPLGALPPGQRPQRGAPADTSPQPGDEVVAEPPSQKITNKGALFSGLDKITGRIIKFDVAVGETVQFGALQVTPRVCYTRPPTEMPNTDAFIEVDEVTLQGDVKRIFTGWMFAASPGLHAVEHPIYDVWLTDCRDPDLPVVAPPPEAAAPAARPAAQATPRRSQPPQAAPQIPRR
jgi:hypothetical protein